TENVLKAHGTTDVSKQDLLYVHVARQKQRHWTEHLHKPNAQQQKDGSCFRIHSVNMCLFIVGKIFFNDFVEYVFCAFELVFISFFYPYYSKIGTGIHHQTQTVHWQCGVTPLPEHGRGRTPFSSRDVGQPASLIRCTPHLDGCQNDWLNAIVWTTIVFYDCDSRRERHSL
ncbi:hypothetical protein STEG23_029471, partial [Scotinomys teguina]